MNDIKLLAMYLPQFHAIPENDAWWGKGHTEWTSCKKARPLFLNHNQPRVPYNNFYYNLLDEAAQMKQIEIAKKYGIYGFCYYHYWFQGKLLLEKPAEKMLKNKAINFPFCFSWGNHTWIHSMSKTEVLIEQTYGGIDDIIEHYNYLRQFFMDDRYILVDNKPVFVIYSIVGIKDWELMKKTWNNMAKEDGFDGIYFIATLTREGNIKQAEDMKFDAAFTYQPRFSINATGKIDYTLYYYLKKKLFQKIGIPCKVSYRNVWKRILSFYDKSNIKIFYGAYPDWDTTARWNKSGEVHTNVNYDDYGLNLKKQIIKSRQEDKEFLFITAWNEWSEGAYLEPDQKNGYKILEETYKALEG